MNIEQHIEHRAWTFQALDTLAAFLSDPDFAGDGEEEARLIERKRRELKDGKYRVVILGEFNVGKSALVNAFLGDEYLPTVLEECTSKITHIFKSEDMKVVLNLCVPVSEAELETLGQLLAASGINADVLAGEDMDQVVIAFHTRQARDLVRALRPLVTMNADEEFPQLRPFRCKFDEIYVHLPTEVLADDVALIDSPGVHSISETNTKIAEEIIPNSHLVICLLDSQNPGTEQNREFIEKVVRHRHRKVLFVINKSDQLNSGEIDPTGHHGPAKDLFRSLRGVVEFPETFFVSALYAIVAAQLSNSRMNLEDLDSNNKIKIPWSLQSSLMQRENPAEGVAEFLMERSNVPVLRDRLLRYLYTENREGAILESACRFVDDKAWTFARPIEVQLEMAREMPRLAEARLEKDRVAAELEDSTARAEAVKQDLQAMYGGGAVGDREYPGYEGLLDGAVTRESVQRQILAPAREWLNDSLNFKTAKQGGFAVFTSKVESLAQQFVGDVCGALSVEVESVESAALARTGALCRPAVLLPPADMEPTLIQLKTMRAGLGASYFGYLLVGGILGAAAAGGVVVSGVLADVLSELNIDMDMALQAGMAGGAAVGALAGILLRAATAKSVLRRKLNAAAAEQVLGLVLGSGKTAAEKAVSIKEQLRARLLERSAAFAELLRSAFESATQEMHARLEVVTEEEAELSRKQEEIIARLEPKVEMLSELGRKAAETAEANAPKEAEAVA